MRSFWVILIAGGCLLVAACLRDRQTRRRRAAAIDPASISPASINPRLPRLGRQDLAELDAFRAHARRVDARLAGERFATHSPPPCAVVGQTQVLCCPEGVSSLRELLPSLAAARSALEPLLVALPALDEALRTGLTSHPGVVAVIASPEACAELAGCCGAQAASRADLQAGLGGRLHGRVRRVVVDDEGCWVEAREA